MIGANGAIGLALVRQLAEDPRFEAVYALSRRPSRDAPPPVIHRPIDIAEERSIGAAAEAIEGRLDLVVIATGLLHEGARAPERALRELDAAWLARIFAINTIGPALVLRFFAPLLPRTGRSAIAALSARVGSVSDNRSGGWYGYRASKAALNMVVRTSAIELARTRPEAICVSLHPGTVESGLSRPFQASVPADKLFRPGYAAARLLTVLDGLTPEQSGRCFAWGRLGDPALSGLQAEATRGSPTGLGFVGRRTPGRGRREADAAGGKRMVEVTYRIVEHDGGWAYKLGDVFSETFGTRAEAQAAADRVAAEQRVPGDTEAIEWEDESGQWHEETARGDDRPEAVVAGPPMRPVRPAEVAAPAASSPTMVTLLMAGCAGLLLATLVNRGRRK